MKINFVLPEVCASGGVKMVFRYAQYLTDQGHDVICYYPLSGAYWGWKKVLFPKMILWQLTKSNYKPDWFEHSFKILHPVFINNHTVRKADVTIATSWLTAYWVNRLSKEKGRKCYFVQGHELWGNKWQNRKAQKSYELDFDEYIVVSSALKEVLFKNYGVVSTVICNGVLKEEARFSKRYNLKKSIKIGFSYRTGEHKNCDMAIEVLEGIEETYGVTIESYGFKRPEGWNEQWKFYENPSREELVSFYDDVDIFYVPSTYEGWGLPAMEAMARGCAVVAHNSGVIHEMGIHNENCIILNDASDREEIEEKITYLLADKKNAVRIGENARITIVEQFLHENSCVKFQRCLDRLCNKKIGILSLYYKNANYGGVLQAYALQNVLDNLGYPARQISYELMSGYSSIPLWKRRLLRWRGIYSFIVRPNWTIKNRVASLKIEKFANKVPHTKRYTSNHINELNDEFDIFICGSDQIWNPIGWQPTLFLNFVTNDKRKLSYAASVARDSLSEEEINYIKEYTRDFAAISVREEKSAEILCKNGIDVDIMPDPTFLLKKEAWDQVACERLITDSYIFAYFLGANIKQRDDAILYAKLNNKNIVFIPYMQYATFDWELKHKSYMIDGIGIPEFLSLIKYADEVITDSFHGTVFSIMYETPFVSLKRHSDIDKKSMNSRIDTLLDSMDMKYRSCTNLPEKITQFSEEELSVIKLYKKEKGEIGLSFLKKVLM